MARTGRAVHPLQASGFQAAARSGNQARSKLLSAKGVANPKPVHNAGHKRKRTKLGPSTHAVFRPRFDSDSRTIPLLGPRGRST